MIDPIKSIKNVFPLFDGIERGAPAKKIAKQAPDSTLRMKNIPPALMEKLIGFFRSAAEALDSAWEKIKNPIDPDWRKNQKYQYVLSEVGKHTLEGLNAPHLKGQIGSLMAEGWIEGAQKNTLEMTSAKFRKGSRDETLVHLRAAVTLLYSPKNPYSTERERYKNFMKAFEKVVSSPWYQRGVNGKTMEELQSAEQTLAELTLIHTMALSLFTKVNTQGFTGDLASKMADAGRFSPEERFTPEDLRSLPLETRSEALLDELEHSISNVDKVSSAIKKADPEYKTFFWTSWGSSIKGSSQHLDFDPLISGGNPANVKYTLKQGNKDIVCIRTPSPTIGPKINPLWIAYGNALKARDMKHTYFNLQDRRKPEEHKGKKWLEEQIGFAREDARCASLEGLNEAEGLKDVFTVVTLDKNSSFYRQHINGKAAARFLKTMVSEGIISSRGASKYQDKLQSHETQGQAIEDLIVLYHKKKGVLPKTPLIEDRLGFQNIFKGKLFSREGSFHIPEKLRDSVSRERMEGIIDQVGRVFFRDSEKLTPKERQDFIEITYKLLEAYIITSTEADCFNTSCKDCIDRGAGENYVSLVLYLLRDIAEKPDKENLLQDVQQLSYKMDEDALWARKREILGERRTRAVQASERLLAHFKSGPAGKAELIHLLKEAYTGQHEMVVGRLEHPIPEVVLNPNPEQHVKNFKSERRKIEKAVAQHEKTREGGENFSPTLLKAEEAYRNAAFRLSTLSQGVSNPTYERPHHEFEEIKL